MARASAEGHGGGAEGVLVERAPRRAVHEACVGEEEHACYLCRGDEAVHLPRANDEEASQPGAVLPEIDKPAKLALLHHAEDVVVVLVA